MATSVRENSSTSSAIVNGNGICNNNASDLTGIFSVVFNRNQTNQLNSHPLSNCRWPSFSMSTRSFLTKYCLLTTICGSAATILAGIFLVVSALFRYYTTSIYYFETVPTYIPAILLSICGVSTIAFSCKRNRNIILLRITACWSLVSAALSSVITITTSLIHMNRLQTLKECVYNRNPPGCTCFSHSYGMDNSATHYVFENTPDCDVIHGILYSCLRAVFAISVVAVLLSIFLCMLLYQLIGHERKKAYWSRIRRINSDWSADFLACLARPMPRERSSMLPLMMTPSASLSLGVGNGIGGSTMIQLPTAISWGPPPPYEPMPISDSLPTIRIPPTQSQHPPTRRPSVSFIAIAPARPISISTSSITSSDSDFLNSPNPHPFSPTITTALSTSSAPIKVQEIKMIRSTSSGSNGFTNPACQRPKNIHSCPPMTLRESKISIDSGSENLYSQDEESFREKMIPFDLPVLNKNDEYPGCSCFQESATVPPPLSLIRTKRINSLPASPLMNSVRNFLRRDRNATVVVTHNANYSPKWERTRGHGQLNSLVPAYRETKTQSLPGSPLKVTETSKNNNNILDQNRF